MSMSETAMLQDGIIVLGILAAIFLAVTFAVKRQFGKTANEWFYELLNELGAGMVGSIITTILFSYLIHIIQINEMKLSAEREILNKLKTHSNSVVQTGIVELQNLDQFPNINLLEGKQFGRADWTEVQLVNISLKNTDWFGARLDGVEFVNTVLYGANFQCASLVGAKFVPTSSPLFDVTTVLPDGNRWSSDVDLNKFIDKDDPNFFTGCNGVVIPPVSTD